MGRLTAMALEDRSAPVRVAAARALEVSADTEAEAGAHLFVHRADAYAWREPLRWIEVTEGDRTLWLPALGSGPWRFALIPGLRDPQASGDTEPALTP